MFAPRADRFGAPYYIGGVAIEIRVWQPASGFLSGAGKLRSQPADFYPTEIGDRNRVWEVGRSIQILNLTEKSVLRVGPVSDTCTVQYSEILEWLLHQLHHDQAWRWQARCDPFQKLSRTAPVPQRRHKVCVVKVWRQPVCKI